MILILNMIRSTKTTLNFANKSKLDSVQQFIDEYKKVMCDIIDKLWELDTVPRLVPNDITSKINTWLSSRAIQCAAKQASGIVRGTQTKQKRRLFVINQLKEAKKFKRARKLQQIYNNTKQSKPNLQHIECELDSRFVKIDLNNKTSFDGWITLTCLGSKMKLLLPFKQHIHFNKMLENGTIKGGVRLSTKNITFMFDIPEVCVKNGGEVLGIDVGQITALATSDGQMLETCPHGHSFSSICKKLARKVKNSKSFNKAVTHRSNFLRYIVNKLNLDNVSVVNRENIQNLRKFKNVSRSMKHWNYGELFEVLDRKLSEQGVLVNKLNPTYTSQRCSACGWTQKRNRKRKVFKCGKCSLELDSDKNASLNLSFKLVSLGKQARSQQKNRTGFYWDAVSEEPIVPCVREAMS